MAGPPNTSTSRKKNPLNSCMKNIIITTKSTIITTRLTTAVLVAMRSPL